MQIFYNVIMEVVSSYWVVCTLAPSHVIGEVIASGSVCVCVCVVLILHTVCVCVDVLCRWSGQNQTKTTCLTEIGEGETDDPLY